MCTQAQRQTDLEMADRKFITMELLFSTCLLKEETFLKIITFQRFWAQKYLLFKKYFPFIALTMKNFAEDIFLIEMFLASPFRFCIFFLYWIRNLNLLNYWRCSTCSSKTRNFWGGGKQFVKVCMTEKLSLSSADELVICRVHEK